MDHIGMDVHKKESQLYILTEAGELLGKGRITKIGESPYKHSFTAMSFAPRHIA